MNRIVNIIHTGTRNINRVTVVCVKDITTFIVQ